MIYKDEKTGAIYGIAYSQEMQKRIAVLLLINSFLMGTAIVVATYLLYRLDRLDAVSKILGL